MTAELPEVPDELFTVIEALQKSYNQGIADERFRMLESIKLIAFDIEVAGLDPDWGDAEGVAALRGANTVLRALQEAIESNPGPENRLYKEPPKLDEGN